MGLPTVFWSILSARTAANRKIHPISPLYRTSQGCHPIFGVKIFVRSSGIPVVWIIHLGATENTEKKEGPITAGPQARGNGN